jgi:hypothetical protein
MYAERQLALITVLGIEDLREAEYGQFADLVGAAAGPVRKGPERGDVCDGFQAGSMFEKKGKEGWSY